jgi:hypothetical protein
MDGSTRSVDLMVRFDKDKAKTFGVAEYLMR